MKLTFSFLMLFSFGLLSAQADFKAYEQKLADFKKYCANAQTWAFTTIENRSVKTHTMDSVVTTNPSGVVVAKTTLAYNDDLHTETMYQYYWDSLTQAIALGTIISFEYGGNDLPINIKIEDYNPDSQEFELTTEMDVFYDNQLRVDSLAISTEDPFTGEFGPLLATKQIFSEDLLVETRQWLYISFFGLWIPSQTFYEYDQDDRLTETITTTVDFVTFEITNESRSVYTYNASGLVETRTDYVWADPVWEPSTRITYAYHGNGTISEEIQQNFVLGAWVNAVSTRYPVEDVSTDQPSITSVWNETTSTWVRSDSIHNHLNPALPWEDVVFPSELSILSLGLGGEVVVNTTGPSIDVTEYFLYDSLSQEAFLDVRESYYYTLIGGSATHDIPADAFIISPNPSQGTFVIEADEIFSNTYTVYNNAGALISKGEMNNHRTEVYTTGWAPGLYFIQVLTLDGQSVIRKQIVE